MSADWPDGEQAVMEKIELLREQVQALEDQHERIERGIAFLVGRHAPPTPGRCERFGKMVVQVQQCPDREGFAKKVMGGDDA